MPKGKKREPSLREKEKQIEADLFDHIVTNGGKLTVLELVEKYVSLKTGVRHNTVAGYKTVINILKKEPFGRQRIDKVRLSDAKAWLIKLQKVDGRGYSSIHSIRGVLRPAFQMAVDDDLIRKNPFGFELASVVVNDSVTREAISRKQERDLLKFIKEDKHFSRYYDGIYILFHTGMRISEFCGLTINPAAKDRKRHPLCSDDRGGSILFPPDHRQPCGSQSGANGRWVRWFSVSGQERYAHGSPSLGEVHGAYCPEV